jgi:lysophospholipase L1-like esterase
MPRLFLASILVLLGISVEASAAAPFPLNAKRILFLGDSNTHAGGFVAWIEAEVRLQGIAPLPEFLNVGLSSETCSGLSEPDHPFPRPDVHERLDRALAKVKPDVVVACYGMNDGIYYPFDEQRFQAFQTGILRLIEKVHTAGAKLILMTPPPFDPLPMRTKGALKPLGEEKYSYRAMYEGYDDVIEKYSKWLVSPKDKVAMVIDLHTALGKFVLKQRKTNPQFTLSTDGVHLNAEGHRIIATTILEAWGIKQPINPSPELLSLVTKRMTLLHDAWLSEIGHKRPGVPAGPPLAEANQRAAELDAQIQPLLKQKTAP